jgi:hypothetical protein
VQSRTVVGEAVEGDLPRGVLDDACVKLVDVVRIVPGAPLDGENGDVPVLLGNGVVFLGRPGVDGDGSKALILRPAVLAGILDNLRPGVLDGFFLLAQLPEDVGEVD